MNILSRSDLEGDVTLIFVLIRSILVLFSLTILVFVHEEARESETVKGLKLVPEARERPKMMV